MFLHLQTILAKDPFYVKETRFVDISLLVQVARKYLIRPRKSRHRIWAAPQHYRSQNLKSMFEVFYYNQTLQRLNWFCESVWKTPSILTSFFQGTPAYKQKVYCSPSLLNLSTNIKIKRCFWLLASLHIFRQHLVPVLQYDLHFPFQLELI